METCHFLHEAMKPCFYHDLIICDIYQLRFLLGCPEGLKALAKNLHFVKTLDCSYIFIFYYSCALLEYSSKNDCSTPSGTLISEISLLEKYLPTDGRPIELVPFPPKPQLTSIKISLDEIYNENGEQFKPPGDSGLCAPIVCLDRIIRSQSNLRTLILPDLPLKNIQHARLLSSILLRLENLQHLTPGLILYRNGEEVILPLCFSVPSSIETLSVHSYYDINITNAITEHLEDKTRRNMSEMKKGGQDVTWEWARRVTPLAKLKEFIIRGFKTIAVSNDFLSFFQDCPNLQKITLKNILALDGVNGAEIGIACPKLKDISYWKRAALSDGHSWPLDITRTLPVNRLDQFEYSARYPKHLTADMMRDSLLRHSNSLQTISFSTPLTSSAQQLLLRECRTLKYYNVRNGFIDLSDAAATPWASSSLNHLVMNVRIVLPSSPKSEYIACYLQTPPVPPSDEERSIFSQLETLYRQIGKQTRLRFLELGGTEISGFLPIVTDKVTMCMPGMLRLNDGDFDRPGFLDLFIGLKRLGCVVGSLHPEIQHRTFPENSKELDWIHNQWPALTFLSGVDGFRFQKRKGVWSK